MIYTLHYSIALEDGTEVLATFGGHPATLAVGAGELAPGFERCLAEAQPGRRIGSGRNAARQRAISLQRSSL